MHDTPSRTGGQAGLFVEDLRVSAAREGGGEAAAILEEGEHKVPSSLKESLLLPSVPGWIADSGAVVGDYFAFVHRCGHWGCPVCGPRNAIGFLQQARVRIEAWPHALMLSLTVDPGRNPDPELVYDRVTVGRMLAKLIDHVRAFAKRRYGIDLGDDWIRVLEFHQPQNGGMPHWHILLKSSVERLPLEVLTETRRVWNERFGVGVQVNYRADPKPGADPKRALRYVAKYFVKGYRLPPWVEERTKRMRFVEAKRVEGAAKLRSSRGQGERRRSRPSDSEGQGSKRIGERLDACGLRVMFVEVVERDDGSLDGVCSKPVRCSLDDVQDALSKDGVRSERRSESLLFGKPPAESFWALNCDLSGSAREAERVEKKRETRRCLWSDYCREWEERRAKREARRKAVSG